MQFTTGADTVFPGIQRVLPGETLRVVDGLVVDRQRLRALPAGPPEDIGEEAALARLDAALERSVELHQRSDVPYGMFLSGGVDSAAVLALMARLNTAPVLAYTAGFDVPGAADERAQAAAVAAAVGARHELLTVTEAMTWSALPRIVAAMDDPAADYAIIPTWFLAQRARQRRQGRAVGRGGRRVVRRLRPISQRDAAVVAWRPRHAVARDVRRAGRVARGRRRAGGTASRRRKRVPPSRAAAACRWRRRPTWRTGCRTTCC